MIEKEEYESEEYGAGIAAMILEEVMEHYETESLLIEIPTEEYDLEVRMVPNQNDDEEDDLR